MEEEVTALVPTRDGDQIGRLRGKKSGLVSSAEWAETLLQALRDGEAIRAVQLCRLAGCSYRQIDYWVRAGIVQPVQEASGSGSTRLFDEEGVRVARIVTRLSALGIPPSLILDYGPDETVEIIAAELESIMVDLVE